MRLNTFIPSIDYFSKHFWKIQIILWPLVGTESTFFRMENAFNTTRLQPIGQKWFGCIGIKTEKKIDVQIKFHKILNGYKIICTEFIWNLEHVCKIIKIIV